MNETMADLENYIAQQPDIKIPEKLKTVKLQEQHIISLRAENVKRLTAVQIDPNSVGVVVLSGANGAGKSSILDAIQMAIMGTREQAEKPVRDGKDRAIVILKTEDLNIQRKWIDGQTYLEVTAPDGKAYSSPQMLLNALVSKVAIDPLAFVALNPKDQANLLLKLYPTSIDLEANAKAQVQLNEQRRDMNRQLEMARQQFAAYRDVPASATTVEVDIAALSNELSQVMQAEAKRARKELDLANLVTRIERLREELKTLESQKESLQGELRLDTANYAGRVTELQQQIAAASSKNQLARRAATRKQLRETGLALIESIDELKKKIEQLVQDRENALRTASFPVPELSVDASGGLVFKGIPLRQCCTSEQIRVGIALAAAGNPGLRVAFIRDGSLLDTKSLAEVAEIAGKYNMQIWVERVEDNSPLAIQIVDGSNIGATDADGKPQMKNEF